MDPPDDLGSGRAGPREVVLEEGAAFGEMEDAESSILSEDRRVWETVVFRRKGGCWTVVEEWRVRGGTAGHGEAHEADPGSHLIKDG